MLLVLFTPRGVGIGAMTEKTFWGSFRSPLLFPLFRFPHCVWLVFERCLLDRHRREQAKGWCDEVRFFLLALATVENSSTIALRLKL